MYSIVKDDIDAILSAEDTFIGPIELKEHKRCYRWPIAVIARALYAMWSKTGDEKFLLKLRDHYINDTSDYSGYRDIVNIETILKLYSYFKDERLIPAKEIKIEGGAGDEQTAGTNENDYIKIVTTPELPDKEFIEKNVAEEVEITLVPYGCTNLRLTVFPKLKEGIK